MQLEKSVLLLLFFLKKKIRITTPNFAHWRLEYDLVEAHVVLAELAVHGAARTLRRVENAAERRAKHQRAKLEALLGQIKLRQAAAHLQLDEARNALKRLPLCNAREWEFKHKKRKIKK